MSTSGSDDSHSPIIRFAALSIPPTIPISLAISSNVVSQYEWVKDYHELAYNDARFILFHYPILEWAHYWRKSVHLYGHNHRPRKTVSEHWDNRAINVGVDVNSFFPISADAIYGKAFGDHPPDTSADAEE